MLFRRVTGSLGDETGNENAIALYMPFNVSPRQAFQSLFAVAMGTRRGHTATLSALGQPACALHRVPRGAHTGAVPGAP